MVGGRCRPDEAQPSTVRHQDAFSVPPRVRPYGVANDCHPYVLVVEIPWYFHRSIQPALAHEEHVDCSHHSDCQWLPGNVRQHRQHSDLPHKTLLGGASTLGAMSKTGNVRVLKAFHLCTHVGSGGWITIATATINQAIACG